MLNLMGKSVYLLVIFDPFGPAWPTIQLSMLVKYSVTCESVKSQETLPDHTKSIHSRLCYYITSDNNLQNVYSYLISKYVVSMCWKLAVGIHATSKTQREFLEKFKISK